MDPRFQTSFIPKKPIVAQTKLRTSSYINLFSFIATTVFIVALVLSVSAFFYKDFINKQIESKRENLERARNAFDPELINELIRLDSRIEISKKLLASHLSITPIFSFIGGITLESVRFDDFSFSYLEENKASISMNGQAKSYASVALQSDLFNKQDLLKDVVMGDMALDQNGYVSFTVTATVDPSLISYSLAQTQ